MRIRTAWMIVVDKRRDIIITENGDIVNDESGVSNFEKGFLN